MKNVPFGTCEICGEKTDTIAMLPIPREDGSLITMGCVPCAIEKGCWCETHDCPYQSFGPRGVTCLACIELLVWEHADRDYLNQVLPIVPTLREGNEDREDLSMAARAMGCSDGLAFVRWVCTAACLAGKSPDEIIRQALETKDASAILP